MCIPSKGFLFKMQVPQKAAVGLTGILSNVKMAHLGIFVPGLIQNGSYVFTHEINSQDCYSGAALFYHLDSTVGHDQAVADVNVRPALGCSGQHPLHLRVHVEMGNNANLLGRQNLQQEWSADEAYTLSKEISE